MRNPLFITVNCAAIPWNFWNRNCLVKWGRCIYGSKKGGKDRSKIELGRYRNHIRWEIGEMPFHSGNRSGPKQRRKLNGLAEINRSALISVSYRLRTESGKWWRRGNSGRPILQVFLKSIFRRGERPEIFRWAGPLFYKHTGVTALLWWVNVSGITYPVGAHGASFAVISGRETYTGTGNVGCAGISDFRYESRQRIR